MVNTVYECHGFGGERGYVGHNLEYNESIKVGTYDCCFSLIPLTPGGHHVEEPLWN